MATAQKRGFRLPWGSEPRNDEASEDLGDGPFDLTGPRAEQPEAEAPEATPPPEPVEAAEDHDVTDAPHMTERAAPARATRVSDDQRAAWPEIDRRTAGPLAALRSAPERSAPEAPAPVRAVTEQPASPPPSMTPVAPPAPKRDNPLVAGLVRAMREAAKTARDEAVTSLHAQAEAHGAAIRTQSADTASELRKSADADVASIKDWSRAELARVRDETEARITARKTQLVEEIEFEAQAAEDRLDRLRTTIEAFEAEMTSFFEALLAEEDPARLAGLAERMPTVPALPGLPDPDDFGDEGIPAEQVATTSTALALEPERDLESAAELESEAELEAEATPEPEAELAPEPELASEPEAASEPTDTTGLADHLDPDAAAAAEAEALAGLDAQTHLVVSGLSSVAGIAGFKAALMHVGGVSAVNVTAGADGEVLFTVTHDGPTDLRDALRGMEAFDIQVIADDGTTLSVAARESAA